MLQAGLDIGSALSRIIPLGATGDEFQRAAQNIDVSQQQAGEGMFGELVRGSVRSLMPMVVAKPLRTPGVIATGSAIQGSQSLTEARDAGLPESEARAFAFRAAVIEGGMEAIVARYLPTLETTIGKGMRGGLKPRKALELAAKTVVNEMGQEVGTEALHITNEWLSSVNEDQVTPEIIASRLLKTAAQAAMLTGGITGTDVALSAAQRRGRLAQLKAVRAKGYVSAEDGQTAGIEGETRKERLASADAEIQQLEQEIQDASAVPSPETEVQQEQGEQDLRGEGQVEVPAEPAGEVAPASEVPVNLTGAGSAIVDNFYDGILKSIQEKGEVPGPERKSSVGRAWDRVRDSMPPDEFVQRLRQDGPEAIQKPTDDRAAMLESLTAEEAVEPEAQGPPKRDIAAEIRSALASGPVTVTTPQVEAGFKVSKVRDDGKVVTKKGRVLTPDETWEIQKPQEQPSAQPEPVREAVPPVPEADPATPTLPPPVMDAVKSLIRQNNFSEKSVQRMKTRNGLTDEQVNEVLGMLSEAEKGLTEKRQEVSAARNALKQSVGAVERQLQDRYGKPGSSPLSEAIYFRTPEGVVIRSTAHVGRHARSTAHVVLYWGQEPVGEGHLHPDSIIINAHGKTAGEISGEVEAGVANWTERLTHARTPPAPAAEQSGVEPPAIPAPEAALPAPQTQPPDTTGTKNVKTDELRQKAGMEERPPVEPETRDEWDSAAAKRIAEDPLYAGKLAGELAAKPRALDPVEEMTLNRHLRDLENRRQSGEDVADEMATAVEASERVGTIWGRAGVSRQAERAADFSLEGIIRQHVRSVNEKPSEDQLAKYAEMTDRIAKLEGELNTERQNRIQAEIDKQITASKEPQVEPAKRPKKTTERRQAAEKKVADAWENFRKAMTTTAGSSGANLIGPAVDVAKAYVELGYVRFSEFIASVRENVPGADENLFRKAWVQAQPKIEPEKRDSSAIGKLARDLTRWAVESGITEREAVIDTVHEDLTGMGFELSRSDTMSAMSGYGEFRELSKDEVSVKVRGIKGEIQQLRKLEDMQAGRAPKKTGVERREPTDEERRLIKEVNEAKKRGGYTVTDPERQLKSALASAKTAARNRISDLEKAIAAREKIVSGQTALKADAELADLRKRRDELNEEYKKIFPPKKNGLSESQRLKMAEKMLDRQLADLQTDLDARRYEPKESKPPLTSPEIEAKRKELKELRERMTAARQAASEAELAEWESEGGAAAAAKRKRPLTDAQRLKAREASLERQIETLLADLAAGRLATKPKATPLSSPEIEAMQRRLSHLKEVREQARAASPEYQAQEDAKQNARYKKTLERSLTFWEKRRDDAAGGKLPAKRKPTPVDNAILEKKRQIELVRREADAKIEEAARAARSKFDKGLGFAGDIMDLSRILMTTGEMSVVLMQGAVYTSAFPIKASKNLKKAMGAIFSRRADFAIHDDLMERPDHADMVLGGVETTVSDGPLSQREELTRSRIVSWLAHTQGGLLALPRWAAQGIQGFERGFRSFSNTMRADMFSYMKRSVEATRPGTWSESDMKWVGKRSNSFSGRGKLPGDISGVGLSRFFFAPRWVWSNAQMATVVPMIWKGDRAQRLAVAKVYVRGILGMAGIMLIRHAIYALLAGDDEEHKPEYELDPRSSDFGKMRLGETRLGSMSGIASLITLAARIATGETKRADGKIVPIRGDDVPHGDDDTRDIIHRFLDSKLAPLPSAVLDFMAGENVVGDKATLGKIVGERTSPMTWRDIWDAEKELNVPQGTVAALDAFFGTRVSTYGSRTDYRDASEEERKKIVAKDLKNMTWDDDPKPAYSEFLTDDQLKKFEQRRQQKRGLVVYNATYAGDNEDELATRDKNRKYLTKMGVSFEEAQQLLKSYYRRPDEKGRAGKITEGYFKKLRALKRIYESQ